MTHVLLALAKFMSDPRPVYTYMANHCTVLNPSEAISSEEYEIMIKYRAAIEEAMRRNHGADLVVTFLTMMEKELKTL